MGRGASEAGGGLLLRRDPRGRSQKLFRQLRRFLWSDLCEDRTGRLSLQLAEQLNRSLLRHFFQTRRRFFGRHRFEHFYRLQKRSFASFRHFRLRGFLRLERLLVPFQQLPCFRSEPRNPNLFITQLFFLPRQSLPALIEHFQDFSRIIERRSHGVHLILTRTWFRISHGGRLSHGGWLSWPGVGTRADAGNQNQGAGRYHTRSPSDGSPPSPASHVVFDLFPHNNHHQSFTRLRMKPRLPGLGSRGYQGGVG